MNQWQRPDNRSAMTSISTIRDGLISFLTECRDVLLSFTVSIHGRLNYAGFHLSIGFICSDRWGPPLNEHHSVSEIVQLPTRTLWGFESKFNTRTISSTFLFWTFRLIFGNMETRKRILVLASINVDPKVFNLMGKSVILTGSVFWIDWIRRSTPNQCWILSLSWYI